MLWLALLCFQQMAGAVPSCKSAAVQRLSAVLGDHGLAALAPTGDLCK